MRVRTNTPETRLAATVTTGPVQNHFAPQQKFEAKSSLDTASVAAWAKTSTPAPINVEHLTDQVIRQIDSRMIAWRERMGKV